MVLADVIRLGYNTNGFAHHRLDDCLAILAELGYRSVAITLDYLHLDPYAPDLDSRLAATAARLREHDLLPVVETGARFVLDPRRKHRPTLLSADRDQRDRRIDFLCRAVAIAEAIGAPVVSLWSGSPDEDDDAAPADLDERLAAGLRRVCDRAAAAAVAVGFEPEPGMYIEDMAGYERVRALVDHAVFRLTLDVGHAHITEPDGAEATVRRHASEIVNVHVEGMRRARHEHLMPDEGDMDVLAVVRALIDTGYDGPATLELSRHSHDAVRFARRAAQFFAPLGLP